MPELSQPGTSSVALTGSARTRPARSARPTVSEARRGTVARILERTSAIESRSDGIVHDVPVTVTTQHDRCVEEAFGGSRVEEVGRRHPTPEPSFPAEGVDGVRELDLAPHPGLGILEEAEDLRGEQIAADQTQTRRGLLGTGLLHGPGQLHVSLGRI